MSYRLDGKDALSLVIKIEKNLNILEKAVYGKTKNDENAYKDLIYEVISEITHGEKLQTILNTIKTSKTGWNHANFDKTRFEQQEQDDFIKNPFQVEEGVLTCPKCRKSRTFSYTRQVRSCDEGTTVFCFCVSCRHKWIHAG